MKENVVKDKSFAFAVRCVNLSKFLNEEKREFVLSKQVLRSGTSIGANVREGRRAQTLPDFAHKMNIALKEADETLYWLELLHETNYLPTPIYDSLHKDCNEIISLLVSIVKTSYTKINNGN